MYDKAIEIFNETLNEDPKSVVAMAYKALALMRMNRNDEAMESINMALTLGPDCAECH